MCVCVSDCELNPTRNKDHIWNLPIRDPETGRINPARANVCADYPDVIPEDIFTADALNC